LLRGAQCKFRFKPKLNFKLKSLELKLKPKLAAPTSRRSQTMLYLYEACQVSALWLKPRDCTHNPKL